MVTSDMYKDIKEFRDAFGLPVASSEINITQADLVRHLGRKAG